MEERKKIYDNNLAARLTCIIVFIIFSILLLATGIIIVLDDSESVGDILLGVFFVTVAFLLSLYGMALFFNHIEYDHTAIYTKNIFSIGNKTIPFSRISGLLYQFKLDYHRAGTDYYKWKCRLHYRIEGGQQKAFTFSIREKYKAEKDAFLRPCRRLIRTLKLLRLKKTKQGQGSRIKR